MREWSGATTTAIHDAVAIAIWPSPILVAWRRTTWPSTRRRAGSRPDRLRGLGRIRLRRDGRVAQRGVGIRIDRGRFERDADRRVRAAALAAPVAARLVDPSPPTSATTDGTRGSSPNVPVPGPAPRRAPAAYDGRTRQWLIAGHPRRPALRDRRLADICMPRPTRRSAGRRRTAGMRRSPRSMATDARSRTAGPHPAAPSRARGVHAPDGRALSRRSQAIRRRAPRLICWRRTRSTSLADGPRAAAGHRRSPSSWASPRPIGICLRPWSRDNNLMYELDRPASRRALAVAASIAFGDYLRARRDVARGRATT